MPVCSDTGALLGRAIFNAALRVLAFDPHIMLGMGLSGFSYMHSDLGGFTDGPQNEELYIGWLQYGMFNPIVRPHGYQVPPEPIHYSQEAQNTTCAVMHSCATGYCLTTIPLHGKIMLAAYPLRPFVLLRTSKC